MSRVPIFESPFDTYTTIGGIGEGGAGRVYEVRNSAGEMFALKCLAPERITRDRLKRFKNEMAFCSRQEHRNVIRIVDSGAHLISGTKCPFYVMKRYDGTLRREIPNIKPAEALSYFAQILDGVEAAHLLGVIHRDLKPENLLFDRGTRSIVVADFGIAHFEEEEIYTAVETKEGSRLANFLYSAPEQKVRNASVGPQTDVYALGLILNELFTQKVPQGSGFTKIAEVSAEHGYLDDLVDAMLQQDPKKRLSSIDAVKSELIGRKNQFVARQKFDQLTKQVVPAAQPPKFQPIKIVSVDYLDSTLILKLDRHVPAGWFQEFQSPRIGYRSYPGYGPDAFRINGDAITILARENDRFLQELVEMAKGYVVAANSGYVQQQSDIAARQEREARTELERQRAEADRRTRLLANIKL